MTSAQKDHLLKLHRRAANFERIYHMQEAMLGSEAEPSALLQHWAFSGRDLAVYRDYLTMQRLQIMATGRREQ